MKRFYIVIFFFLLFALGLNAQVNTGGASGQSAQDVQEEFVDNAIPEGHRLLIPTAFTPNGDGINDSYLIDSKNFSEIDFSVFDRFGNQIFHATRPGFVWDGNISGKRVKADIYVFIFNGVTNQGMKVRKSGTISVIY